MENHVSFHEEKYNLAVGLGFVMCLEELTS